MRHPDTGHKIPIFRWRGARLSPRSFGIAVARGAIQTSGTSPDRNTARAGCLDLGDTSGGEHECREGVVFFPREATRIWYWPLTIGLVAGLGIVPGLVYSDDMFWSETGLACALALLALGTYVMFALAAKRLHDRDRSGWYTASRPRAHPRLDFFPLVHRSGGAAGNPRRQPFRRRSPNCRSCEIHPFFRRLILSDRGDTGSSFALVVLVLAGVAGFFIAKDWAASHHVAITTPGQYVDAAFRAVTDKQYWADLKLRLDKGSQTAGASLANSGAVEQRRKRGPGSRGNRLQRKRGGDGHRKCRSRHSARGPACRCGACCGRGRRCCLERRLRDRSGFAHKRPENARRADDPSQ